MSAEKGLWIVGAGGLGREVLDAAMQNGAPVAGFVDEAPGLSMRSGHRVVGTGEVEPGARFVVAVGDGAGRRRLVSVLEAGGGVATSVAHPLAGTALDAVIGPGCVLLHGCFVSTAVTIGAHSQVQYNATVGHDSVLGRFVTVLPGANVSGGVTIGDGATVGAAAVVLQGLSVGPGAFVGAGAVVTRDVAADTVVVGSPARVLRRTRGPSV